MPESNPWKSMDSGFFAQFGCNFSWARMQESPCRECDLLLYWLKTDKFHVANLRASMWMNTQWNEICSFVNEHENVKTLTCTHKMQYPWQNLHLLPDRKFVMRLDTPYDCTLGSRTNVTPALMLQSTVNRLCMSDKQRRMPTVVCFIRVVKGFCCRIFVMLLPVMFAWRQATNIVCQPQENNENAKRNER